MPWRDTTIMDQKVEFILEWQSGKYSITELCRAFNISRVTAYKVIHRYETKGLKSFTNRSRKPLSHPNATKEKVVEELLNLKQKYPGWGAKKLRTLLFNVCKVEEVPSVVTVHNILLRNGLVCPQKRLRRVKPINPIFDPQECNEVWSADYKGKFRMGNKLYCHPLTIADSRSRFIFSAKGMYREDFKSAQMEFKRVFRRYGIPKQMHTDNGTPFGSVSAIQRFTRLSYWFIDLGIMPVFSDPARPDQNGRHERMHRELKASCTRPSGKDLKAQQRKMNSFIREYNNERPHEALDMETPAMVHTFSTREFPEFIREYDYPSHYKVLNVTQNGMTRWKSYYWVYMSQSLKGCRVGAEEIGNGIWRVYYRNVFLGYFDEKDIKQREKSIRLSANLV